MQSVLMPLLEQAIVNGVLNQKAPFIRKNKFGLGLLVLSGLLFFTALLFLILSGYGWLLTQYTQTFAALIVSAGIFIMSVILALSGYVLLRKKHKSFIQSEELMQIISEVSDMIGKELAEPIQDNPKTAIMLASLAGFIAGDHLH